MSENNDATHADAPRTDARAGRSFEVELGTLNRVRELDLPAAVAALAPAIGLETAWALTQALWRAVAGIGSTHELLHGGSLLLDAPPSAREAAGEEALARLAGDLETARDLADDAYAGLREKFLSAELAEGAPIVPQGAVSAALAVIAEVVRRLDAAQELCDRLDPGEDAGSMTIRLDPGTEAALVLAALERLTRRSGDPMTQALGALAELAELPAPVAGVGHAALPCGMHATYRRVDGGVTVLALRAGAEQAINDTVWAEAKARPVLSPAIARRDRQGAVLGAWSRSRNLESPFAPLGEIREWVLDDGWHARGFGLRSGRLLLILGVGRDRSRLDLKAARQVALIESLQGRLDEVRQRGPRKAGSRLDASSLRALLYRLATERDSDE